MEGVKAASLTLIFLLGIAVAAGLSVYHKSVRPGESYHLFYSFPSEEARPIIFKYGAGGFAKILDPNTLGVTIGLTNRDRKPHLIGFKLEGLPPGIHVHWFHFYSPGFDEEAKAFKRPIPPRGSVSVHLTFFLEEAEKARPIIYSGHFKVYDLKTGETLLRIPIKILNVKAGGISG